MYAAPVKIITVEVPHGIDRVVWAEDVPSTSLGAAIVFVVLSSATIALASRFTWECYSFGRQLAGSPPPRWKTLCFNLYVLAYAVSWTGCQIKNQMRLRQNSYHEVFGASPGRGPCLFGSLVHTYTHTCPQALGP